jgi:NADH:ubiquinone oxidoreductase subunit 4 (subunit M)
MQVTCLLAALFLPLFPFSALFVVVHRKIKNPWARTALFLLWPQPGVILLTLAKPEVPDWVLAWATATALLYAIRALVVRELGLWLSYIGVSCWAIIWLVAAGDGLHDLALVALGMSLPLSLMTLLARELEKRFTAAYAGLYGGIVQTQPRLAALLVVGMLAVTATPLFPGFFTMLTSVIVQMSVSPLFALGLLLVWLLWTWSGMRLLQGLVMGPVNPMAREFADLETLSGGIYSALLVAMVWFGFQFSGGV